MPSRALPDRVYDFLILETLKDRNKLVALRDALMYKICRITGLRPMECRCIKIEHINFEEDKIFIPAENNKERHSDDWIVPKEIIEDIYNYIRVTQVNKYSKWLFPCFHNRNRKQDLPVDRKTFEVNFKKRIQRLGFLHVSFIDKQGKPRYNYNLYSLRKRYGTEKWLQTRKNPQYTRYALRQRDKTCKSIWSYIEEAEREELNKKMVRLYNKARMKPVVEIIQKEEGIN